MCLEKFVEWLSCETVGEYLIVIYINYGGRMAKRLLHVLGTSVIKGNKEERADMGHGKEHKVWA